MQLESIHVDNLRHVLIEGRPLLDALPKVIGNTSACSGFWRFYSDSWPFGGIQLWNADSRWRLNWRELIPQRAFAFGEDVFGNQLLVMDGLENVFLWNHENAECVDLYFPPVSLLETILKEGVGWIDFYDNGSIAVARQFGPVANDFHLHWTTPLILGGVVNDSNISIIEREAHLIGHAKLWSQVRDLPPGTKVMLR